MTATYLKINFPFNTLRTLHYHNYRRIFIFESLEKKTKKLDFQKGWNCYEWKQSLPRFTYYSPKLMQSLYRSVHLSFCLSLSSSFCHGFKYFFSKYWQCVYWNLRYNLKMLYELENKNRYSNETIYLILTKSKRQFMSTHYKVDFIFYFLFL